jgi:hypothetical protein
MNKLIDVEFDSCKGTVNIENLANGQNVSSGSNDLEYDSYRMCRSSSSK